MQKIFFEILVRTALTVGLFWTTLKLTPKSALLSFTILYCFLKIVLPSQKLWCNSISNLLSIVYSYVSKA